ncbi:Ubiquinone biosynthesis O-methyltransferase [uncultured archaeon]|nr:Ubiquinone biosynthesis O-methyltransferase [uncultured archaeon]
MIVCPLCKTQTNENSFVQSYFSSINDKEYKLYHCFKCQLYFWDPMGIVAELYEKEMFDTYDDYHMGDKKLSEWCIPFFTYFPLKKGRLLDVGCADGVFLEHAQRIGFEVWGIDFDGKSIEAATKKRGLKNVYQMSLENFIDYAHSENLKFDVITFFEVLEHQDNLDKFLTSIKSLLKDEGYIAGSVPNGERLLPEFDHLDYPPHHFTRWSKNVLRIFLNKEDFTHLKFYPASFFRLVDISYRLQNIFTNTIALNFKKTRAETNVNPIGTSTDKNKKFPFPKKIKKFFILLSALFFSVVVSKFKKAQNIYFQAAYVPFNRN